VRSDHPCSVLTLTDRSESGDFRIGHAQAATMKLGGLPLLVVIKKNTGILQNILTWLTSLNRSPSIDGHDVIKDLPLLLIDDEADYASINTADPELDPTRTNHLIREILATFEKSSYVGYTATPFANLFISDTAQTEEIGRDLFPRNFIVALRPPSNYVGPTRFFGIDEVSSGRLTRREGLPLVRTVIDHEVWIPDKHNKHVVPAPIPRSLKNAIQSFVLACSARRSRQHHGHNSMLVHVTRFVDVQALVREQISDYVMELKRAARYVTTDDPMMDELKDLWESDMAPTTKKMVNDEVNGVLGDEAVHSWSAIRAELNSALERVEVRQINGTSADTLDY